MKKAYTGLTLYLENRVQEHAFLLTEGERIHGFGCGELSSEWEKEDLSGLSAAPGFIDIHLHGGGGHDFMEPDPSSILKAARAHLEHGTTSILPTSCTSTNESLFRMFDAYRSALAMPQDGARLMGIHLEGPYLSPVMKGAMLEELLTIYNSPSLQRDLRAAHRIEGMLLHLLVSGADLISRWTVAPERAGALSFGDLLANRGIVVSAGHTTASPALMREAASHGFTLATHLYNAMTAMHKEGIFRLSGAAEGALSSDAFDVEVVADGIHQPLEILNIAWRVKGSGKMCLITDATAIAGAPVPSDGKSILAEREVLIEDGVAKLADRSAIAGSIATGDVLLRKGAEAGIPLPEVVRMLTATPARIAHLSDVGVIREGALADIVFFDDSLSVKRVVKGGRTVFTGDGSL